MITINGQKMGKSWVISLLLDEFFSGSHKLLDQAYSPMTIRFFILQAHSTSTVDFSNDARAADKEWPRDAVAAIDRIRPGGNSDYDVLARKDCYTALNDDATLPYLSLTCLMLSRQSTQLLMKAVSSRGPCIIQELIHTMVFDILGLKSGSCIR